MDELIKFKTAQIIVKHNIEIKTLFSFTKEGEFKAKHWDKNQTHFFPCCTQTTLKTLLREKYKMHIDVRPFGEESDYPLYTYSVIDLKDYMSQCKNSIIDMETPYETLVKNGFKRYEDALEEGFVKAIEQMHSNVTSVINEIGRPNG